MTKMWQQHSNEHKVLQLSPKVMKNSILHQKSHQNCTTQLRHLRIVKIQSKKEVECREIVQQ